jgi:hypothetical protein
VTDYREIKVDIATITKTNTKALLTATAQNQVPAGIALDGCIIGVIGALLEMTPRGQMLENLKNLQDQFNEYIKVAVESVHDVERKLQ